MENKDTFTESIADTGKNKECCSFKNVNDKINDNVTSACLHKTRKKRVLSMSGERSSSAKQKKLSQDPCLNVDQKNKEKSLLKQFEKTNGICFKSVKVSLKKQNTFAAVNLNGLDGNTAVKHDLKAAELKPDNGDSPNSLKETSDRITINKVVDDHSYNRIEYEDQVGDVERSIAEIRDDNSFDQHWQQNHTGRCSDDAIWQEFRKKRKPFRGSALKEEGVWERCQEQVKEISKLIDFKTTVGIDCNDDLMNEVMYSIQTNLTFLYNWLGQMAQRQTKIAKCKYFNQIKQEVLNLLQCSDSDLPKDDELIITQEKVIDCLLSTLKLLNEQVLMKIVARNEKTTREINQYTDVFEGKTSFSDIVPPWDYLISKMHEIQLWKNEKGHKSALLNAELNERNEKKHALIRDFQSKTEVLGNKNTVELCNSGNLDSSHDLPNYKNHCSCTEYNDGETLDLIKTETLRECFTSVDQIYAEIIGVVTSSKKFIHQAAMRKAKHIVKCSVSSLKTWLEICINEPEERRRRTKCHFLDLVKVEVLRVIQDEDNCTPMDDDWMETQERILGLLLKTMAVVSESVLDKVFHICEETLKKLNQYVNIWNDRTSFLDIDRPWEYLVNKMHEIKRWKNSKKKCKSVKVAQLKSAPTCSGQLTGESGEKPECVAEKESGFCLEENVGFEKLQVNCHKDSIGDLWMKEMTPQTAVEDCTDSLDGCDQSTSTGKNTLSECQMCIKQIENDLDFSILSQKCLHIKVMKEVESTVKKALVHTNRWLETLKIRYGKKRVYQVLNVQSKKLEVVKTEVLKILKDGDLHIPNDDDWMGTQEKILECLIKTMILVHDQVFVKVFDVNIEAEKTLHLYADVWNQKTSFSDIERPWEYLISKLHEIQIWRNEIEKNANMKMKLKSQSDAHTNGDIAVSGTGSNNAAEIEKNVGLQGIRTVHCLQTFNRHDTSSMNHLAKLEHHTHIGHLDSADTSSKKETTKADDSASNSTVDRIDSSSNIETDKINENTSSCRLMRKMSKYDDTDNACECTVEDTLESNIGEVKTSRKSSKLSHEIGLKRVCNIDASSISKQPNSAAEDGGVCTERIVKVDNSDIVKQIDILNAVVNVNCGSGRIYHKNGANTTENKSPVLKDTTEQGVVDIENLFRADDGHTLNEYFDCFVKYPLQQDVVNSCLGYIERIQVNCEKDFNFLSGKSPYLDKCKKMCSILHSHLLALSYFLKYQAKTLRLYNFFNSLKLDVVTMLKDADKIIPETDLWIEIQTHILDRLFCTLKAVYENVLVKVFFVKEETHKMIDLYYNVCKGVIALQGGGMFSDFLLDKYNTLQRWATKELKKRLVSKCQSLAGPVHCNSAYRQQALKRLKVVELLPVHLQPVYSVTLANTSVSRYIDVRPRPVSLIGQNQAMVNACTAVGTVGFNIRPSCTKTSLTTTVVLSNKKTGPVHAYDMNLVSKKPEVLLETTAREATDDTKQTLPNIIENQETNQESRRTMPVNSSCVLDGISAVLQDMKEEHEVADELVTVKEEPVEDEIAVVQNPNSVFRPSEQILDVKKETEDVDIMKDIKQEPLADVKQSGYVEFVMSEDSVDKGPFLVTLNEDWVSSIKSPIKTEDS